MCEEQKNRRTSLWPPYSLRAYAHDPDLIVVEPMTKKMRKWSSRPWSGRPNPLLCVLKYFPDELTKPLGHW
jgi:hypothetical protein